MPRVNSWQRLRYQYSWTVPLYMAVSFKSLRCWHYFFFFLRFPDLWENVYLEGWKNKWSTWALELLWGNKCTYLSIESNLACMYWASIKSKHGGKLRGAKTQSWLSWSFQSRIGDDSHPNHNAREKAYFCFFLKSSSFIIFCVYQMYSMAIAENQAI